jgi:hypothetical protein
MMNQVPAVRKATCTVLMLMAALMLLSPVGRAGAAEAERILSFDRVVTVHTDSTMTVQETIHVVSAGISIQHGLYRDFPTTCTNPGVASATVVHWSIILNCVMLSGESRSQRSIHEKA